jgi:hypothetical protein
MSYTLEISFFMHNSAVEGEILMEPYTQAKYLALGEKIGLFSFNSIN